MTDKAMRPDVFFNSLPTIIADRKAESKGATDDERMLYSMSRSRGWKVLKEYIGSLTRDLEEVSITAMSDGKTFEEIGRNALVVDMAKGIIRNINNKVEDARESCEKDEEEK